MYGYAGNDNIQGGSGNDTLYGGDDDDWILGGAGNDHLSGDAGDDTLKGGAGNDTFYYTVGVDTFSDTAGTDEIHLSSGYLQSNMTHSQVGNDLNIFFNSVLAFTIDDHFASGAAIETLVFADSSTYDLTSITSSSSTGTSTGTSSGETLYGSTDPLVVDELDGGAGNDTLYGYAGNDILTGGSGTDYLYGGAGDDTYVFASGFGGTASSPDQISENANEGYDSIHLTSGTTANDYYWWTENYGVLKIQSASNADDLIQVNGVYSSEWSVGIEEIVFDDGSRIDFTNGYIVNDSDAGHGIYGSSASDVMDGNGGNDTLYGYAGNDILTGGSGTDYLYGGTGDDTYVFASGSGGTASSPDQVTENAGEGHDTILITGGLGQDDIRWWTENYGVLKIELASNPDDLIQVNGAYSGGYVVSVEEIAFDSGPSIDLSNGYVLNDSDAGHAIYGSEFADDISGNGGNDTIYGYAGDDILIGGSGTDYLYGGTGDDTYVFASGFGGTATSPDQVTENANEGYDTILMTGGLEQDDIRWWTENYGVLKIELVSNPDDVIQINGAYSGGWTVSVEEIAFDNAPSIDLSNGYYLNDSDAGHAIYGSEQADEIYGNGGNDTIYGYAGDDLLRGGSGTDYLYGGAGDDTYVFASGFGGTATSPDQVTEYANEGYDQIILAGGLDESNIRWWTENYGVLKIQNINNPDETISVNGVYNAGYVVGIEQLTFENGNYVTFDAGYTINDSDDGHASYGSSVADTMDGNGGNDTLYGYAGNDTLNGGEGNDYLYGDAGDDIYVFGSGLDYVSDTAGSDTLAIEGGFTINDIKVSDYSSYDTKVILNTSVDEITLGSFRFGTANQIETIKFDDGFETSLPDYNSWLGIGSGNDLVAGGGSDETLIGYDGNDTLQGNGGADDIHGGAGMDTLEGGAGADLLHGGTGDDILYGGDDLDTLYGGSGADTFMLEDTTAFNDIDVIKDFDVSTDDDVLDISDILDGTSYVHGTDAITDWVEITTSGSDSVVKIDTAGAGSFGAGTQVATLEGVTGLTDEAALITSGNLIAA